MSDLGSLSGASLMKLMKEMKALLASPPEGTTVHFSEENVSTVLFDLTGPVDTPFEGGFFRIKLQLPADYPNSAPKGWFLTKIFHPNVNFKTGEICVSTLKKDWSKTTGLKQVLVAIRCLLIEPNPESALNEDAGKLLLENYADYFARAKMMTKVHAKATAAISADAATETPAPAVASSASTSSSSVASVSPTPDVSLAKEASSVIAPAVIVAPVIPAVAGEEENANLSNVNATVAVNAVAAVKAPAKPLAAVSVNNAAATAPIVKTVPSAASSAAAAAEAKAKALKKKSLKRL